MTTARTIIRNALRDIGAIGMAQTPAPEEEQAAFSILNRMIDAWSIDHLLTYALGWTSFAITSAMTSRTIGVGGQVNVARPPWIGPSSYVRVGTEDYPLPTLTPDQWARIDEKTLAADRPYGVYYEPSSPLGVLHFYPQGDCTVYLNVPTALSQFATVNTDYTFAPGNEDAITLSLSERLCRPFTRPVPNTLTRDAALARDALRKNNFRTPELFMPQAERSYSYSAFLAGD